MTNISTSSDSSHSLDKPGSLTVQRVRTNQPTPNILNISDKDDDIANEYVDRKNHRLAVPDNMIEDKISICPLKSPFLVKEAKSPVFKVTATDTTFSNKYKTKTNFFGSSISSLYRSQDLGQVSASSLYRSQDMVQAFGSRLFRSPDLVQSSGLSLFRSQNLVQTSGSSLFRSQDLVHESGLSHFRFQDLVPASGSSLYRSQDDFGYYTGYTAYSNLVRDRISSDSLKSFATPESFSSEDNVPMDSSEEMFHKLFVPDRTFDDISHGKCKSKKLNDLPQKIPVEAKLVADGVNVLYKAPPPPSFNDNFAYNNLSLHLLDNFSRDEIDEFREKVASASPMRRSESSSMSLGMTWCSSSRDSLLNSPLGDEEQESSLKSLDYAPQIMTEDCIPSPGLSGESSMASAKYYSTYIPDKDLDSEEIGSIPGKRSSQQVSETCLSATNSSHGQVGIVHNPYTIYTSNETNTEDTYEADDDSDDDRDDEGVHERAWKSNSNLDLIKNWKPISTNSNKIKYASESNIFDDWDEPLENGLRNIQKDNEFSSCDKSEDTEYSDPSDECIYYKVNDIQKPRFSVAGFDDSMLARADRYTGYCDNVIPEEPSDYEDSWTDPQLLSKHINIIKVENNNNDSNEFNNMVKRIHVQQNNLTNKNKLDKDSNKPMPKKHVTLIRIDSDPYKTNLTIGGEEHECTNHSVENNNQISTNPVKAKSPTLTSIRVGSVKDLTKVFEGMSIGTNAGSINVNNQSLVILSFCMGRA